MNAPSLLPAACLHAALLDSRLAALVGEMSRLMASGGSRTRIANTAWDAKKLAQELAMALGDVWTEAEREADAALTTSAERAERLSPSAGALIARNLRLIKGAAR